MQQLLTIVLWTAFEYLVLKTLSKVAPQTFQAFIRAAFYIEEPPTP